MESRSLGKVVPTPTGPPSQGRRPGLPNPWLQRDGSAWLTDFTCVFYVCWPFQRQDKGALRRLRLVFAIWILQSFRVPHLQLGRRSHPSNYSVPDMWLWVPSLGAVDVSVQDYKQENVGPLVEETRKHPKGCWTGLRCLEEAFPCVEGTVTVPWGFICWINIHCLLCSSQYVVASRISSSYVLFVSQEWINSLVCTVDVSTVINFQKKIFW